MPLFLLKFLPLLLKLKGPAKIAGIFLKGNWKIVVPVIGVLIFALLFHLRGNKIDNLEEKVVLYTEWLDAGKAANQTNQETIAALEVANAHLAEFIEVSEEVRLAADTAAIERARRAEVRLDDARTKLRELENETSTCTEISSIDIGAACPLSVELLRRAAAGTLDRN